MENDEKRLGIWHDDWEDKERDLAEAERLKRTGLPFDEEILKKYGFGPEAYEWQYESAVDNWWFDSEGRTITDPKNYVISTLPGTEGMPMTKEEIDVATKKLEKTMSVKAVKGGAKKAGDKGAPEFPWAKKSEAASAGGKGKKAIKMLPKKKGNIKELNA